MRVSNCRMRKAPLVFALLLALLAIGCSKNPLVGTWEGSDPNMGSVAATFTFNSDHTYNTNLKMQDMSLTVKGTYTLEGDKLTLQPESLDATGGFAEMAKAAFEKDGKKPLSGTVAFKDDTMTLTANGQDTTLKKKS